MSPAARPGGDGAARLEPHDRRVDQQLAQLGESYSFLLDLTPTNAQAWRKRFLAGEVAEPRFTYRPTSTDPDVLLATLDAIDVDGVADPTVAQLLRGKRDEMRLQAEMLRARDTRRFLPLSIQAYGTVGPQLRQLAQQVLDEVPPDDAPADPVSAREFHAMALAEIGFYRAQDPGIVMRAEVREDVNGVLVSGDTLLLSPEAPAQRRRAHALLQHEIGTHLVTQVNGAVQPVRCLGAGLAGYDETQEGLAVLAEVAVGQLTRNRLRQLAGRVMAVDALVGGAGFVENWQQLVSRGFPRGSAFTTVMRVHRSGGFTKDACYLRGMVDLVAHLRRGGVLDTLYQGKFALKDLPLVERLGEQGLLRPTRLTTRYRTDPECLARLERTTQVPLAQLTC